MSCFSKMKNLQKASVTIFVFFISLNNVYSQDFKLAGVYYAHYPKGAIKDVSGNQETSFHEYTAFVHFPKKLKNDKTALINGIGYGFVEATMHDFPLLQTSEYQKNLQAFYIKSNN